MTGTATVTAKTGPGVSVTSKVFNDVTGFDVQLERDVIFITHGSPSIIEQFSLTGVTTFTVSISGTVYTITIS